MPDNQLNIIFAPWRLGGSNNFCPVLKSFSKKTIIGIKRATPEHNDQKDDGFFKPESVLRKINQEGVILLGGGYAILLQLAHPFVAAGVDDFSRFQADILSRLFRTILFMHNMVFEDRRRALHALQHFHQMHARIRGRLRSRAGRFPAGTPYSGDDPQTKLWVHATFIATGLKVYEFFIQPLTPEERRRYYSDSLILAELFEIPADILPPTLDEFEQYMTQMLSGDTLAITDTSRRLAHAVLYPKVGFWPSLSAGMLRFVTAGLLPERFRQEYDLPWNSNRQFLLNSLRTSVRLLRPIAPAWVWQTPLREGKLTYYLLWGQKKRERP